MKYENIARVGGCCQRHKILKSIFKFFIVFDVDIDLDYDFSFEEEREMQLLTRQPS